MLLQFSKYWTMAVKIKDTNPYWLSLWYGGGVSHPLPGSDGYELQRFHSLSKTRILSKDIIIICTTFIFSIIFLNLSIMTITILSCLNSTNYNYNITEIRQYIWEVGLTFLCQSSCNTSTASLKVKQVSHPCLCLHHPTLECGPQEILCFEHHIQSMNKLSSKKL